MLHMSEGRYLHLHDRTEAGGTEVVEWRWCMALDCSFKVT